MNLDPILSEVRRIKEERAQSFNFDIEAMGRELMESQGVFDGGRLLKGPEELQELARQSDTHPLLVKEDPPPC